MENENTDTQIQDGANPQDGAQTTEPQVNEDNGTQQPEVKSNQTALQSALEKAQKEIDDKNAEDQKAKQGADGNPAGTQQNKDDKQAKADDGKTPKTPASKTEFKPQEHWSEEQKTFFNSLDPQNQKVVLDMYKGIQKVYEKKTLDLSKQQKTYESYNEAFKPYEDIFQKQGIDKSAYIKQMIELDRQATSNPVEFVIKFLQSRNLNLDHVIAGIQQMSTTEYQQYAPLKKEIETLKKQLQDKQSQSTTDNFAGAIEEFKTETDDGGNPAHPYFDEVQEQMAQIAATTGETDLAKLYEQAVWTNPEVRAKLIEAQKRKSTQEDKKQEQLKKTQAAAGLHIKNSAAPATTPKKQGLRSIIEELDKDA